MEANNQDDRPKLIWFLKVVIIILVITGGTDLLISFYGSPRIPKTRNPFMTVTYTPTPASNAAEANAASLPTIVISSPVSSPSSIPQQKMCPMDAKMCPDGKTFVGRSGPNCAFVSCPTTELRIKN